MDKHPVFNPHLSASKPEAPKILFDHFPIRPYPGDKPREKKV